MNRLLLALLSVLVAIALAGCDVHQFPDEPDVPPPPPVKKCQLTLHFDNDDFDYLTTVNVGARSGTYHSERNLRVIVRLYPYIIDRGTRSLSRSCIEYHTSSVADDGTHPDFNIPLEVPSGEYRIIAWADHVMPGSVEDLYYTSDDFIEVRLPGVGEPDYVHKGNTEFREAWRGTADIVVNSDGEVALPDSPTSVVELISIEMERPLARYHFVTNDLRKFLETEVMALGTPPHHSPSLDNYRIVVRYTGYMSCSFNVIADKPVDSTTGVYYDGQMRMLDNDRAEIAFDHLFVNHAQTSVLVALDLYRLSDGTRLSSTGAIDVPLQRGHYTLIEGPLLTTMAGAGAGIVPDFSGEFNVEIK